MHSILLVGCLSLIFLICIYLKFFSSYRTRNWNGFVLLFFTFTIHWMFILILPFCQLYLLYFLLYINIDSFDCVYHPAIVFYCVIESFFFLFTIEEARLLNARPLPERAPLPKDYNKQCIDRVLNVYEKSKEDFRICFTGWFVGNETISSDLIYEENILEYLSMATYGVKYWNEMTHKQQHHIKHLYKGYFKRHPHQRAQIKSGYNSQIQMRHPYRDSIQYTHYPLTKYIIFAYVRSIMITLLVSLGYEHQMIDNVPFYIKKCSKKTSSPPILFLHGLSLGSNNYIAFIRRLTSLNRMIILLDVPHASMRLQTEILSISSILSSIKQLFLSLNEEHIITISHSYGTIVHSCIIKQLSHLVYDQPTIFIDPVCFLLFDSRYIDNFIYRKPRTPNQLLLYTSCTEDLYSIYHIKRHLCWYECNLWTEDLKQSHSRIHVFFSENDDIVPVSFVTEYLKKSNIDFTIYPQFKHGQFLVSSKFQEDVLDTLHQLEIKPSADDTESVYF